MRVSIGGSTASCPACGEEEFAPVRDGALEFHDDLACTACTGHVLHAELILQLVDPTNYTRSTARP